MDNVLVDSNNRKERRRLPSGRQTMSIIHQKYVRIEMAVKTSSQQPFVIKKMS